jgi:hypothetical protein
MVGLQLKVLHEIPSKIANWEPKSSLKMSYEDYELTRPDFGGELVAREPAFHLQRDPPREAEPFKVRCSNI